MNDNPASPRHVVIVGGGLAGAKTAEALRAQEFDGDVTLLAAEPHLPYERPPLSKGYLIGKATFDEAIVHPEDWYRDHRIDLRRGTRADAIDAIGHRVGLADGTTIGYDKLVLATGAQPRRLLLPGADAEAVYYLRTREDSDAIRACFGHGQRLVVIGGGWIGLEVAAAARGEDTQVTVLEAAALPLLGVLGPEVAQVFADLHRAHGVEFDLGVRIEAITTSGGRATGVQLSDGTTIAADAIVVGVGAVPDLALAESAGLDLDNGVLVDACLRSSDPDIYAVGDLANQDHPVFGHRVRVEHWATALKQPAVAVAALLGQPTPYTELPYFYSGQYDLSLEYVGHAPNGSYDQVVVRGDLARQEFVAFWLAYGRIKAAMNVNVWDVVESIKPRITAGWGVNSDRLADPSVPYDAL
jgi:3-phenylpropionate/trans-cinnamate dioxygenase ferredoxin reductase subunit